MNAFGFAYGVLIATYGLITLPIESERFDPDNHAILVAFFMGLAGVSQLSGPLAGYFSDRCVCLSSWLASLVTSWPIGGSTDGGWMPLG
jgi:hypothetical protein